VAGVREVEDVMAALDEALAILDEHVIYDTLPESARRLVNQAVFLAIVVSDPDNVQAQLTPLYETIKQLIQELRETKERPKTRQKPTTPGNKTGSPQNDRDPDFRGRGSYIGRMAGATGQAANLDGPLDRLLEHLMEPMGRKARRRAAEAIHCTED
jgi:hypothetical protein